jgi:Holliday junction resolvasome RuvABC endonuclease subunit
MLAAFDYSMSCPALCISSAPGLANSKFYYLTDVKKLAGIFYKGQVIGADHNIYKTQEERYNGIAQFFMDKLHEVRGNTEPLTFYIEDYSMGSKGKVFNIAENTAVIKHKLWQTHHKIVTVPPTVIKKFATGKGNSDKEKMYVAFVQQTGVDINQEMFGPRNLGSPTTDLVDCYFLAQYAWSIRSKNV